MNEHGKMTAPVALLLLAGFGLLIAGAALAPETPPSWLMGSGGVVIWWALYYYHASARRRLDPRASERKKVTS